MHSHLFCVSFSSGTLFVENIIDREKVGPLLTIVIRATDGGDPDLNATVEANVTISDINDNSPVFDGNSSCTHIAVNENSEPGSTTGCTVVAVDEDPVFGDITYSIQGGNIFQWFDVNGTTVSSLKCHIWEKLLLLVPLWGYSQGKSPEPTGSKWRWDRNNWNGQPFLVYVCFLVLAWLFQVSF